MNKQVEQSVGKIRKNSRNKVTLTLFEIAACGPTDVVEQHARLTLPFARFWLLQQSAAKERAQCHSAKAQGVLN